MGAEIREAKALIADHGFETARSLLPTAVRVLKVRWPDAATFSAMKIYLPEILKEHGRRANGTRREEAERKSRGRERAEKLREEAERAKAKSLWDHMAEGERESMRERHRAKYPANMRIEKHPGIIERNCLDEIAANLRAEASGSGKDV